MRFKLACVLIVLAGCAEEGPPLDELPLRDALRADPQVVASMSDERRARLAARLAAARTADVASDPVAGAAGDASALVAELDAARGRRSAEPLIVGEIRDGTARPTVADRGDADTTPLPPLEPAADVTPLEARALAGAAGSLVRAVLAASGARNLRRVVGWPIGAVALGDTAYVNGAWLAALARVDAPDAGADASASPGAGLAASPVAASTAMPPAPAPGSVESRAAPADVSPASPGSSPDGGVYAPLPPPPAPPNDGAGDACSSFGDACAGSSEDDSCGDDDGGDSCDDGGDDGGGDACSDGGGDACGGADADPSCEISRGRHRGRTGRNPAVTLFGPLAFLLTRRQR